SADVKMAQRNGSVRSLTMTGKIGRNTPLTGSLRGRPQGRDVVLTETDDAGAFFRFTDTYGKMFGGQLARALDPPTAEQRAKQGPINVRDFTIKGESALDRVAAGGLRTAQNGISFSRLRAEFSRQIGHLAVSDGVVKGPTIGATIE